MYLVVFFVCIRTILVFGFLCIYIISVHQILYLMDTPSYLKFAFWKLYSLIIIYAVLLVSLTCHKLIMYFIVLWLMLKPLFLTSFLIFITAFCISFLLVDIKATSTVYCIICALCCFLDYYATDHFIERYIFMGSLFPSAVLTFLLYISVIVSFTSVISFSYYITSSRNRIK